MPNELAAMRDGFPVSIPFRAAAPAANATTQLLGGQGSTGFVVPAGYVFHPTGLFASSSAALTAGTATFNVTAATVALTSGPTAVLSSTAQQASGLARVGAAPQAAAVLVGVNVVTNAGYLPVTANHDVVLVGVLIGV